MTELRGAKSLQQDTLGTKSFPRIEDTSLGLFIVQKVHFHTNQFGTKISSSTYNSVIPQ